MAIEFDRKISIDGVAVIIASIAAIFWFARLESKVEANTTQLSAHETKMDRLMDTSITLQQNIAVLNALQTKHKENP